MPRFTNNRRLWRTIALALLVIAMFGPWTYEGVYMPPDAPCTWPNVQPEGHPYCGLALPGLWEIAMLFPLAAALLGGPGSLQQWAAQSALPLLLSVSIGALGLLLFIRRDARPLLFALAWGLAALAGIGFLNRGYFRPYALPWGNLLFIAVALTALALELLRSLRPPLPTPPDPPPGHSLHPGESRQ